MADALTLLHLKVGCPWIPYTNDSGVPDTNASYYIAALPTNPPPGAKVLVRGTYPQLRYFGFILYQNHGKVFDHLPDAALIPDQGGVVASNPAEIPESNNYHDTYTVTIQFSDIPELRAPNTLYTGTYRQPTNTLLMMRAYMPNPGADALGNQPLPELTYVDADGSETNFADNPNQTQCALAEHYPKISPPGLGLPLAHPKFVLVSMDNSNAPYPNPASGYARALISQLYSDLVFIRYRKPVTPISPDAFDPSALGAFSVAGGGSDAQVRYMSVCQNNPTTTYVAGCINDQNLVSQADNYVNVIIATHQPDQATPVNGYNFLPWGGLGDALVLIRQILPNADFPGNYMTAIKTSDDPIAALGVWAPTVTYCNADVFNANATNGGDAAFAACQAAYRGGR